MRYCAAAETGYETMADGRSSEVFIPDVEKDDDGNIVNIKQRATADDYIKLAIAAIVAAYAKDEKEPPITGKDILYDAGPQEVTELIRSVIELRNEWYSVPKTVPEKEFDDTLNAKQGKNA